MDSTKNDLIHRLDLLVSEALSVTFEVADETGFFSIDDASVGVVRDLLERTVDQLAEVIDYYEDESALPTSTPVSGDIEDLFLLEIGAAISSELATREIASLAFAIRATLLGTRREFDNALETRNVWAVASSADTGHRRLCRGLISIETSILDFEQLPQKDRLWNDVRDSLETRRLYGQFRRAVARCGTPSNVGELSGHLLRVARRIAILRKNKIYPFLRIDDRVPLRRLHERIVQWLEQKNDGETPESDHLRDGLQVWGDLTSFTELLRQINMREDLREHDRRLILSQERVLFSPPESAAPAIDPHTTPGSSDQRLDATHLRTLDPLLGRDDHLDDILLHPHQHTVGDLREPLERLRQHLNQPFVSSETSSPLASLETL